MFNWYRSVKIHSFKKIIIIYQIIVCVFSGTAPTLSFADGIADCTSDPKTCGSILPSASPSPFASATVCTETTNEACTHWTDRVKNMGLFCPSPVPGFDGPITMNDRQFPNYAACQNYVTNYNGLDSSGNMIKVNASGGLGGYCSAKAAIDAAMPWETASSVLYGLAAGACLMACATDWISAGTSELACLALGAGSFAADLGGTITVTQIGDQMDELYSNTAGLGGASGALGGVALVGGLVGLANAKSNGQLGKLWESKDSLLKLSKLEGTPENALSKEDALKKKQAGTSKFIACVMAGLTAITFAVKVANTAKLPDYKNDACKSINSMAAIELGTAAPSPSPKASPSPDGSGDGNSGNNGGGQAGALGGAPGENTPIADRIAPLFTSPEQLAALAGKDPGLQPLAPKIASLADTSKVAPLANALANGATPGQALASAFPDLPTAAKDMLKKLDEMPIPNMQGLAPSAAGGKGGAGSKNDPFNLGAKSGPGGTFGTLDFAKAKPSANPSDGDVFHSKFQGTIFQIATDKLGQLKDRLNSLPWQLDLNRINHGLKRNQ